MQRPNRFCLGFFCWKLSWSIARSTVTSPTSRARREVYCAGRTGLSWEELQIRNAQSYPSKKSPLIHGANISAQENAPRRAGPCRQSKDWCHGIDAQAEPAAPALDIRTVLRFRTRTLRVGHRHGRRLFIVRVSTNLCSRLSPLYRSCHDSFCKSSSVRSVRFSLDGPSTEVPIPISGVPREPKASSSSRSLPTTDHGAPDAQNTRCLSRTPGPRRLATYPVAWTLRPDLQLSPTQPVVRRSEVAPSIRVKSPPP